MIAALANCCANKILVKEKFGAHTRYALPQKQPKSVVNTARAMGLVSSCHSNNPTAGLDLQA